MTSGIYCIENLVNNKKYIGSTQNVENRLKEHLNGLIENKHENSYLQKSFNKHGIQNFKFYICEECSKDKLLEIEDQWMEELQTFIDNGLGYNLIKARRGEFSKETRLFIYRVLPYVVAY